MKIRAPERLRKRLGNLLAFWGGLLLVIGLWELIAFLTGYRFLPEFGHTALYMFGLLGDGNTWLSLGYSALRLSLSLVVSSFLGIVLGLAGGYYEWLGRLLSPLMTVLKAFPTVALILLLIIYVPHASLYVVSAVLLPVVYQAAHEGASYVYGRFSLSLRLEGKNRLTNLTRVVLPLSMNHLLLGVAQAVGLGIKIEVMAETFAYESGYHGVGKDIYLAYQNVEYDRLMAYVLLIIIIALGADFAVRRAKKSLNRKIGINNAE